MDELFGVAGMVEDERTKQNIEREIGLYALLGGDESEGPESSSREKIDKTTEKGEVEQA